MSSLQIEIIDKTYTVAGQSHRTIADLQLQIAAKQFVCLVGPSGCGKTTLLNIIAGLDSQYKGQIRINHASHAAPSIGFVFQNPRLVPWLTVRQNIELMFQHAPPAAAIDSLLLTMQLQDVQHRYPERLSLGMQRRVAIIRAFAINPDLLIMDEPFVSLDAPTARQIRSLLYQLWQSRPHTVLFVSHDLREAIALADRLIFLSTAPTQVVADLAVSIPRESRNDTCQIEAYRSKLMLEYPAIAGYL